MIDELVSQYCKFGNFCEIFIFANSVKIHMCDVKYSRLGHVLPISLNNRVISGVLFSRNFAKIKPSRKFQNLQYLKTLMILD